MFLAAISDAVLIAGMSALVAIIGTVGTVALAMLAKIKATGEKNHLLSNSAMGFQLRLVSELSNWKASKAKGASRKLAVKAAAEAERMLRAHEASQTKVDAMSK